jgi:hypothetical protein
VSTAEDAVEAVRQDHVEGDHDGWDRLERDLDCRHASSTNARRHPEREPATDGCGKRNCCQNANTAQETVKVVEDDAVERTGTAETASGMQHLYVPWSISTCDPYWVESQLSTAKSVGYWASTQIFAVGFSLLAGAEHGASERTPGERCC